MIENTYSCGEIYKDYDFKSERLFASKSYQPFVYLVREIASDKFYVGSRTAKNCLLSDLGSKYFTSSKRVYPLWKECPDSIEVIEIQPCASNHDALILEDLIIDKVALMSPDFLNICRGGYQWNASGTTHEHSEETKEKIRKALTGNRHSEETKAKLSEARKGRAPWNKGLTGAQSHTEESRKTMSVTRKGRVYSDERNAKIGDAHRGIPKSEEHNRKNSEAQKRREKITCEHCGKMFDVGNFRRWHGDNCRSINKE